VAYPNGYAYCGGLLLHGILQHLQISLSAFGDTTNDHGLEHQGSRNRKSPWSGLRSAEKKRFLLAELALARDAVVVPIHLGPGAVAYEEGGLFT
jgi:hypothetical protein